MSDWETYDHVAVALDKRLRLYEAMAASTMKFFDDIQTPEDAKKHARRRFNNGADLTEHLLWNADALVRQARRVAAVAARAGKRRELAAEMPGNHKRFLAALAGFTRENAEYWLDVR